MWLVGILEEAIRTSRKHGNDDVFVAVQFRKYFS
jgi:hypothetical protein